MSKTTADPSAVAALERLVVLLEGVLPEARAALVALRPQRRRPRLPPDCMTASAAARVAGVGTRTLWDALQSGELAAVREGHRWSISDFALDNWLQRRRRQW